MYIPGTQESQRMCRRRADILLANCVPVPLSLLTKKQLTLTASVDQVRDRTASWPTVQGNLDKGHSTAGHKGISEGKYSLVNFVIEQRA